MNRRGASVALALGLQNGLGNSGSVGHDMPVAGINLGAYQGPAIDSEELSDDLEPVSAFDDVFRTGDTVDSVLELDSFGIWLYLLFTGGYTAGGGVGPTYTHDFIPANADLLYFWLEKQFAHATTPKYDLMYDCLVTSIAANIAKRGGSFRFPIGVMGTGRRSLDAAAPVDATLDAYTGQRSQARLTEIQIDSVAADPAIRTCDFTIRRDITDDEGLNGEDYSSGFTAGGFMYELRLTAPWDYADTLRDLADGAAHTVDIIIPGEAAGEQLTFAFSDITVPVTDRGAVPNRGRLDYTLDLRPGACAIELINGIADYSTIVVHT